MKGLYIERHNEAVACVSKAVMEGRKGGRLTAMMVDARWHGKVTGIAASDRICFYLKGLQVLAPQPGQSRASQATIKVENPQCGSRLLHGNSIRDQLGHVCMFFLVRYQEKHAQHQQLITHLKEACHADIKLHLLILTAQVGSFI